MAREQKPRSDFGMYLAATIKRAGISQYTFYSEAEIAKPYFYDIITGKTNPPPRDKLEKMLGVLNHYLIDGPVNRDEFFNLAAKDRQEIPVDIFDMIKEHPEQWNALRLLLPEILTAQNEETDDGKHS